MVRLIGSSKLSANQTHYQDLGSDASLVWDFYVRLTLLSYFAGKPFVSVDTKCRLFCEAIIERVGMIT